MKLAIDIEPLTNPATGIYRYSANLIRALKSADPELQIIPGSFSNRPCLIPTDSADFQSLFGSDKILTTYRVESRHSAPGTQHITHIQRYPNRFLRRYVTLSKTVKVIQQQRKKGLFLTKLKREACRGLARWVEFLQNRRYRSIEIAPFVGEVDVIHSFYGPLPAAGSQAKLRCQTVHDIIPILFDHSRNPHFDAVIASARSADVIISISQATKNDLLKLEGFEADKIVVIPLAAAPHFKPAAAKSVDQVRTKLGIPPGIPYFLSVSTLEPRKNFPFLLKAFQKLIQTAGVPPCRLVLSGRMGWKEEVNSEIAGLFKELEGWVHYAGFVSDDELIALYTGADAFLFPSTYEGFGLPLLESMACGTPVISSNTSSMPEVTGQTGSLLAPDDEQGWIEAMRDILLLTVEQKQQYSETALQHASQFSWEHTAKLTLATYREFLAKK